VRIAPKSVATRRSASRIRSVSAVSRMSCVVAPKWKAGSSAFGRRACTAFTNGIVGTPRHRRSPPNRHDIEALRVDRRDRVGQRLGRKVELSLSARERRFRFEHRAHARRVREAGAHSVGREERAKAGRSRSPRRSRHHSGCRRGQDEAQYPAGLLRRGRAPAVAHTRLGGEAHAIRVAVAEVSRLLGLLCRNSIRPIYHPPPAGP
jgi:hypothetical protein